MKQRRRGCLGLRTPSPGVTFAAINSRGPGNEKKT
jgi:hypothetical protein